MNMANFMDMENLILLFSYYTINLTMYVGFNMFKVQQNTVKNINYNPTSLVSELITIPP